MEASKVGPPYLTGKGEGRRRLKAEMLKAEGIPRLKADGRRRLKEYEG
jgi:hypothetical protein